MVIRIWDRTYLSRTIDAKTHFTAIFPGATRMQACQKINGVNVLDRVPAFGNDAAK